MKNESVGDLQLCVKEANLFHKLAHCLDANNPIDLIYGSCYPFAVNLAFACELYLNDYLQSWEPPIASLRATYNFKLESHSG